MPRRARKLVQEIKILHIVVHAIGQEYIYKEDRQKYEYIKLMKDYMNKYHIKIISYCIMDNHAHILIKFDEIKELSKFMQIINTKYAIYYNKNNNRTGYVYQNRFYSEPIMDNTHFLNCIVYIHNNPVKAKKCKHAEQYKFSSYNEILKNKSVLEKYFGNKNIYAERHEIQKQKYYFLDCDTDRKQEAQGYIYNYLEKVHKNIESIKKDKRLIKNICSEARRIYKISYKDVEKILNISSEKLRKILNE